ncbi:MAG: hypothetical protein E7311_06235 [Clostridiales bacterium]|nr:hypothetical protein [Clostridiales bacterium]
MKKKNEGKKLNIVRLIIVFAIFAYVLISLINLFLDPVNKVNIVQGKISDEQSVEGYIIREETVLNTNNVSDIILSKPEESKVAKGQVVGTYTSKNNDSTRKKIEELDVKIQSALQEQTDLYSSDTKKIETEIEQLLQDINNSNEMQKINQKYTEIHTLLEKKAKLSGELSSSGSYINELISQRNAYEKELNESTDYIKSTSSGIVSIRVDGLENVLRTTELDNITYEMLEEYNLRTDEIVAIDTKKIKIVDNYYCYLVTNIENNKYNEKIEEGKNIKVRFNIGNSETINATIVKVKENENSKTVFLKISKNVEDLILYRKISFDIIWWEYEGLKVPNASLVIEGQNTYITKLKNNAEYKVLVKVLKQNNDYAIIDNLNEEDMKKLGITEQQLGGEISIYDEIKVQ